MRFSLVLVLFLSWPAQAQDQDIQRALLQRDQATDAFALQLRQSVEAAGLPPASRPALEARQLWERQRLESVSEKQLLEAKPEDRQKAAQERCAIVCF